MKLYWALVGMWPQFSPPEFLFLSLQGLDGFLAR